jgi:hypothetical protein
MRDVAALVRTIFSTPRPRVFVLEQPLWPLPIWVLIPVIGFVLPILMRAKVAEDTLTPLRVGRDGWMSGWALSHLLGFFLIALILPDHWFIIFWAGVLWELFEYGMANAYGKEHVYWYHVWFDIALNGLGIALGVSIMKAIRTRGPERKRWVAFLLVVLGFATVVLFGNDQSRYIDRSGKVRTECGCGKTCDYDLEAAPRKA